jgi:hypothetical protein
MVPPYDLATGRLRSSDCHPAPQELDTHCSDDDTLVDEGHEEKGTGVLSKRVFCHSRFSSFVRSITLAPLPWLTQSQVEETANERLIVYHVVKALQKHQCKAAVSS